MLSKDCDCIDLLHFSYLSGMVQIHVSFVGQSLLKSSYMYIFAS